MKVYVHYLDWAISPVYLRPTPHCPSLDCCRCCCRCCCQSSLYHWPLVCINCVLISIKFRFFSSSYVNSRSTWTVNTEQSLSDRKIQHCWKHSNTCTLGFKNWNWSLGDSTSTSINMIEFLELEYISENIFHIFTILPHPTEVIKSRKDRFRLISVSKLVWELAKIGSFVNNLIQLLSDLDKWR